MRQAEQRKGVEVSDTRNKDKYLVDFAKEKFRRDVDRDFAAKQRDMNAPVQIYFDRKGKSIGPGEWTTKFIDISYKTVKDDIINLEGKVYRIFTGWDGMSPPLIDDKGDALDGNFIFYTGLISETESPSLLAEWRTINEAEAIRCHDFLLSQLSDVHKGVVSAKDIAAPGIRTT